ncbi:hypothetical protein BJ508DRAFT_336732 [Ascobolus immersus RN42]|uniref:Uncharacterized protein n=1 Tax=Ascobolus immersus RN42 TaxID=1160509 RepID=A0A3N4HEI2_ASCIM|nr:hypothetical protein BJ508DRAFT_336732 [Ascobolus immersus RN42]
MESTESQQYLYEKMLKIIESTYTTALKSEFSAKVYGKASPQTNAEKSKEPKKTLEDAQNNKPSEADDPDQNHKDNNNIDTSKPDPVNQTSGNHMDDENYQDSLNTEYDFMIDSSGLSVSKRHHVNKEKKTKTPVAAGPINYGINKQAGEDLSKDLSKKNCTS